MYTVRFVDEEDRDRVYVLDPGKNRHPKIGEVINFGGTDYVVITIRTVYEERPIPNQPLLLPTSRRAEMWVQRRS